MGAAGHSPMGLRPSAEWPVEGTGENKSGTVLALFYNTTAKHV